MDCLAASTRILFLAAALLSGCGGKAPPSSMSFFALDASGDVAGGYGGIIPASRADAFDATIPLPGQGAHPPEGGPGDDPASDADPAEAPSGPAAPPGP